MTYVGSVIYTIQMVSILHLYLKAISLGQLLGAGKVIRMHILRTGRG